MACVAFVIISHSQELAEGVVELASQMAPDIHFELAAGEDTGGLGTSMSKVEDARDRALARIHKPGSDSCRRGVLLLTDLGSSTMVAQTVLELRGNPKDCMWVTAPLVEGTVAAAVAAHGGSGLAQVAVAACQSAIDLAERARTEIAQITSVVLEPSSSRVFEITSQQILEEEMTVSDPAGLHARPAALLVRALAPMDAQVWINDVDASSVLELMSLGVRQGQHIHVRAQGLEREEAMRCVREMLQGHGS